MGRHPGTDRRENEEDRREMIKRCERENQQKKVKREYRSRERETKSIHASERRDRRDKREDERQRTKEKKKLSTGMIKAYEKHHSHTFIEHVRNVEGSKVASTHRSCSGCALF